MNRAAERSKQCPGEGRYHRKEKNGHVGAHGSSTPRNAVRQEEKKPSCRRTGQQHATPLVRPPVQHREIHTAVQTQLGSIHQYILAPMANQKKGALDKMNFRKSVTKLYSDDSTFQPERRARLPHFFANREGAEVAEGSVHQAWYEQRARYPLPTQTERVSATRKAHITAQISMSREPDCPSFTRIEAISMLHKAQNKRACPPVQYRELPTAVLTQLGPTRQYTSMLALMTNQKRGVPTLGRVLHCQYSDDSTFQPEQRTSLPHFFANREGTEVAEEYSRLGVSRGPDTPFRQKTRECRLRGRLTSPHRTA